MKSGLFVLDIDSNGGCNYRGIKPVVLGHIGSIYVQFMPVAKGVAFPHLCLVYCPVCAALLPSL